MSASPQDSRATESLDYVGVRPCGCVTAWRAGDSTPLEANEFYAEMAESGREVRRVTPDQARAALEAGCPHQEVRDG